MRKRVLLICVIFLLIGCKKLDDHTSYIELVMDCLNDNHTINNVSLGYKYYVPKGVKKIHDYDYNQVFLVDGNYIYLYVDIVSYFYKKQLQSEVENGSYYEKIDFNGNTGYIRVSQEEEDYFVEIVYHYSKIEVYTTESELNKIITLSSIILNSITYNDTVIEKVLEGDFGEFSEFAYEVDKPEGASNNFSQYLEEYVQKEEEIEQLPDE